MAGHWWATIDRLHSLPAVQTIHTGQGELAHGARGRLRANAPEQTATNFGFGDDGPRLVKVAEVALLVAEVPPLRAEVARTAEIARVGRAGNAAQGDQSKGE